MHPAEARKQFCKIVNSFYNRNNHEVFNDFLSMAAISLRQPFERSEKLEKEYLEISGRYKPEEIARFPQLLGLVVAGLEEEHQDFLGAAFHDLELHNTNLGQFFTPYHLCLCMARMQLNDKEELLQKIEQNTFIKVNEPACGAGAMLIAVDQVFREYDINPARHLYVLAQDIDRRSCCMAFIQLALLGVPGCVSWGDTLKMQPFDRPWFTPVYNLNWWNFREQRPLWKPEPPAPEIPYEQREYAQKNLFDEGEFAA